ncbi:MAG: DUF359 domain-containing protein [Thermoplasmatales archaeon]|jgi:Uncharacterized protein conserved in archaea
MPLRLDRDIIVSQKFRNIFSKKPDVIIKKETQILLLSSKNIITVGDVVTDTALKLGIVPKLAVIDLKTKREIPKEVQQDKFDKVIRVNNPPGTITKELWESVEDAIKSNGNVLIIVEGEEDLASLPAIYFSPKGSIILYGIPDEGIAVIESGDSVKTEIEKYIKEMGGGAS